MDRECGGQEAEEQKTFRSSEGCEPGQGQGLVAKCQGRRTQGLYGTKGLEEVIQTLKDRGFWQRQDRF